MCKTLGSTLSKGVIIAMETLKKKSFKMIPKVSLTKCTPKGRN
jgi:hypothetical protein